MAVAYYEKMVQEDLDTGVGTSVVRNPGGGTLTGTQVGIHSLGVGQLATTATWDPGSIASGASSSTTVTVSGASLGDFVHRSFSLSTQGLTFTADVTAANTVTVVLANLTGAAVDLASGTLKILVLRSR